MHLTPNPPPNPKGRPRGIPDKRTLDLEARVKAFMLRVYGKEDWCPILAILDEVNRPGSDLSPDTKIIAYTRVAEYIYPRLKAVEVNVNHNDDVRMDVVNKIVDLLRASHATPQQAKIVDVTPKDA